MSFKRISQRFSGRGSETPATPNTAARPSSSLSADTNGGSKSDAHRALSERSLSIANGEATPANDYRKSLQDFTQTLDKSKSQAAQSEDALAEERLFDQLQTLQDIRSRCNQVFMLANRGGEKGSLLHFAVDLSKLSPLINSLTKVVQRDYGSHPENIPSHGRWQHLEAGGVSRLDDLIKADAAAKLPVKDTTRTLLDLTVVSVLLDAGAGNTWSYKSGGKTYRRSEGLAVASFDMFAAGAFSSDESSRGKLQVDSKALRKITPETLAVHFQVSEKNRLDGLAGRAGLLSRLADALEANPSCFGSGNPRPGNMLDYILSHRDTKPSKYVSKSPVDMHDSAGGKSVVHVDKSINGYDVSIETLWEVLIKGLHSVWPEEGRLRLAGKSLGDVWKYPKHPKYPTPEYVPFHKLTQWMCYSVMIPMRRMMGVRFINEELLTGLPEYRNGGLLIDCGLLTLNERDLELGQKKTLELTGAKITYDSIGPNAATLPTFDVSDPQIVEWRAVTVAFLDYLHRVVKTRIGDISLAQFLEAASWKTGREYAEYARPITKSGPILINSDGTVF